MSGRSPTAVTIENIAAVRDLLEGDRHITYREIKAILRIGSTAAQEAQLRLIFQTLPSTSKFSKPIKDCCT